MIFWSVWATAAGGAFSLGLGGDGTATLSAGQGFGPKMQYGGGLSLDFVFPLSGWIDIDLEVDAFTVAPSDLSGGFLYRGYSGGALALSTRFLGAILSSPGFGVLRAGGAVGLAGALPSYWYTTLAFFYLEPRVEGLLEWSPGAFPSLTVQLSLPISAQLRRDMDYSLTAGLGLGVFYTFGVKR